MCAQSFGWWVWPGDQETDADDQEQEDPERPHRGAHRLDLRPFGGERVAEVGARDRDGRGVRSPGRPPASRGQGRPAAASAAGACSSGVLGLGQVGRGGGGLRWGWGRGRGAGGLGVRIGLSRSGGGRGTNGPGAGRRAAVPAASRTAGRPAGAAAGRTSPTGPDPAPASAAASSRQAAAPAAAPHAGRWWSGSRRRPGSSACTPLQRGRCGRLPQAYVGAVREVADRVSGRPSDTERAVLLGQYLAARLGQRRRQLLARWGLGVGRAYAGEVGRVVRDEVAGCSCRRAAGRGRSR